MDIPQNLQHRPFYVLPYEDLDGYYAGNTDAKFISMGLSQWDNSEVSVKVLRYDDKNKKWSRQSEELPIHRAIDMALWASMVLFKGEKKALVVEKYMFHGQTRALRISPEDRSTYEERRYDDFVDHYFNKDDGIIKERLRALLDLLNDLKAKGHL